MPPALRIPSTQSSMIVPTKSLPVCSDRFSNRKTRSRRQRYDSRVCGNRTTPLALLAAAFIFISKRSNSGGGSGSRSDEFGSSSRVALAPPVAPWAVFAQTHEQQRQREQQQRPRKREENRSRRSSPNAAMSLHNPRQETAIRDLLRPDEGNRRLVLGNHTSNVAIVVSSSRYWFNYRHAANALSIYHLLRKGGMPDENIILMLADDIPCNPRNVHRGKIYSRGADGGAGVDLMEGADVDYSGTDVTTDAFLRVLLGRHLPGERGRRRAGEGGRRSWPTLDENTNVFVYLTGHGGDNFFKFQDGEELMSSDVASAFAQMRALGRYRELLFIADTCQAFTMADEVASPNVFSVGSSLKDQNSYASHGDMEVGQSVMDRYSKTVTDYVEDAASMVSASREAGATGMGMEPATANAMERTTLYDALVLIPETFGNLGRNSNVGHTDALCERKMNQVPLSDFFAAPAAERKRRADRKEHETTASLWMPGRVPSLLDMGRDEASLWGENGASNNRDRKPPTESAENHGAANDENSDDELTRQGRNPRDAMATGMAPSDPRFLVMVLVFILGVHMSSRVW